MRFSFLYGGVQMDMPVTPGSYSVACGRRIETINISVLGDVYRPGGRTRFQGSFEFLLPAQDYPWAAADRREPQAYLDFFRAWMEAGDAGRMILTGTDVNLPVYIEEAAQEERDGTGDRYLTLTVREYVELTAPSLSSGAETKARPAPDGPGDAQSCTVRRGDTLGALCRRYYGNSSARYYKALASYNGIQNPNVIRVGQVLKIPPVSTLFGGEGSA